MRNSFRMFFALALLVLGAVSVNAQERISLQEVPFCSWDGWDGNASKTGDATCEWGVGTSTGNVYGDMIVINYADLTSYSKLILTVTEGTPRVLFNRLKDEGQAGDTFEDSYMVDIPNKGWCTSKYQSVEGNVYTYDLKAIAKDYGFVHLHAIKGANWASVTVESAELEFSGNVQQVGWTQITTNASFDEEDMSSYAVKVAPSTAVTAPVVDGAIVDGVTIEGVGVDGGNGLKLSVPAKTVDPWDSQFWIVLPQTLPEGTKYRVFFDYKASTEATVSTQAHRDPGNYIWYAMLGDLNFTTDWQTFASGELVLSADQAGSETFQSIAFNLSVDTDVEYYFDNIRFEEYKYGVSAGFDSDIIKVDFRFDTNLPALVAACGKRRLMYPTDCVYVTVDGDEEAVVSVEGYADGRLYVFMENMINEGAVVKMTFKNPADAAYHLIYDGGPGGDVKDFDDVVTYDTEAAIAEDAYPYSFMTPILIASDPESGSFNLPNSISEFKITFDKPADASQLVAMLNTEKLAVVPAEGFAEEFTLTRTSTGDLASGSYYLRVTNIFPEMGELYGDTTLVLNVGKVDLDPSDTLRQVLPDYFAATAAGSIPEGWYMVYDGTQREPGSSYSSGACMKEFGDGGEFTRGFYTRTNNDTPDQCIVEYGSMDGYALTLEAGKKFKISYNLAAWAAVNYVKFEIYNPNGEVAHSRVDATKTDVKSIANSSTPASGTNYIEFTYYPEVSGDYKVRWTPCDAEGNLIVGMNEALIANPMVTYIPNVAGVEELHDLLISLNTAKEVLKKAQTNIFYAGTALDALADAVAKYEAEYGDYTHPSDYTNATLALDVAKVAMRDYMEFCDTYHALVEQAENIVLANAYNKFANTELYANLEMLVGKYAGITIADTEMQAAVAELQGTVVESSKFFTQGVSQVGTTGVAALVERLRLGAESLKTLGVNAGDELIVAADNALSDDDALATEIQNRLKKEIYGQLRNADNSLFEEFLDEETLEVVNPAYDMTVFVKNPNVYRLEDTTEFSEKSVPGWTVPEGFSAPELSYGWDDLGYHICDCMFWTWGAGYAIEQTIVDLPAGVYNIVGSFGERTNDAGATDGSYFYVKTSAISEGEVGDTINASVIGQAFPVDNITIKGVTVIDGMLTIGAVGSPQSHTFFNQVKVYMVGSAEGFDYAQAYNDIVESAELEFSGDVQQVGWTQITTNASFDEEDMSSYAVKVAPDTVVTAPVVDGAIVDGVTIEGVGVDGGNGLKLSVPAKTVDLWDSQFWIVLPQALPEGTKYRVFFDYKADKEATVSTEAHSTPSNYLHWEMLGDINFTTEWQSFEYEGTLTASQAGGDTFQSIAFDLSVDSDVEYYFDNIRFEEYKYDVSSPTYQLTYVLDGNIFKTESLVYGTVITAPDIPIKEGYTSSGWNGLPESMPAHDVTVTANYILNEDNFTKEVLLSANFNNGINPFFGWGNNSTLEVMDGALKITNPSVVISWEAQMAYDFDYAFLPDNKYTLSMKVRGSAPGQISAGLQKSDNNYALVGEFGTIDFDENWRNVEVECLCNGEGGRRFIFSFGQFEGDIYIDDLELSVNAANGDDDNGDNDDLRWANILINSDLEGEQSSSFVSVENDPNKFDYENDGYIRGIAEIIDGVGVDGSRGIKVKSFAGATNNWDAQFWIVMPQVLPAGTEYRISFDHRASADVTVDTEAHANPSEYIYHNMLGSIAFTPEWQHYEKRGVISAVQASNADGLLFKSIAFDLATDKENDVEFFFDNIKFEITYDLTYDLTAYYQAIYDAEAFKAQLVADGIMDEETIQMAIECIDADVAYAEEAIDEATSQKDVDDAVNILIATIGSYKNNYESQKMMIKVEEARMAGEAVLAKYPGYTDGAGLVDALMNLPMSTMGYTIDELQAAIDAVYSVIPLFEAENGTQTPEYNETPLTDDMFKEWDGVGANAITTGLANSDNHIGEELGAGATVYGYSTVYYLGYADLTGYDKIVFEGTPGVQLRVLMNRIEDEGAFTEVNPVIDENGKAEVYFTDMEYVHLNAIKIGWASPTGTITSIYLVKGSEFVEYKEIQGIHYRLNDQNTFTVTGYDEDLGADITILESIDNKPVTHIEAGAFKDAYALKSVTIPSTITNVGASAFSGCHNLLVVQWNAAVPLDAGCFDNPEEYGNMLVFTNMKTGFAGNVVVNGVTDEITLIDGLPFRNPQEFTAKKISYTRHFTKRSKVGEPSGWEGLVLPFDVQTITSENKGLLSPFGKSDLISTRPFWMAEWQKSTEWFTQSLMIVANQPFIIAMPNSEEYDESFNIEGNVTFSAQNATVHITELQLESGDFSLNGCYESVPGSLRIYALNDEEYTAPRGGGVFMPGGAFVADSRDIRPFEAYVYNVQLTRSRYLPIGKGGSANGLPVVMLKGDSLVDVYTIQGVLIRSQIAVDALKRELPAGIYIVNNKKMIIR